MPALASLPSAWLTDVETPIGGMVAAASDTHLLLLEFAHRKMLDEQLARVRRALHCDPVRGESPVFDLLRRQLDEYFRAERRDFDIPLLTPGTPFQNRVWDELRRIPYGTTTSYM